MSVRTHVIIAALAPFFLGAVAGPALSAERVVTPVAVTEMKALFGQVESRFVAPARSRIGGTLVSLDVSEGSSVKAGQVIAKVEDTKLDLQLTAADARIASAKSQLANGETELKRNEELLSRGATTVQRVDAVRTSVDVLRNAVAEAQSAREVIQRQMDEGEVIAPADGLVLTVPLRLGEVVMAGEAVATIAGGGVFLRLAIPERHAMDLKVGAEVVVGDDGQTGTGQIEKIYPLIENGRVTADVAVKGLDNAFVGQRVLVRVPVAVRQAIAVPQAAITTRSGLDVVQIAVNGVTQTVSIVPGEMVTTPDGPQREVLTGLRAGDTVIVP